MNDVAYIFKLVYRENKNSDFSFFIWVIEIVSLITVAKQLNTFTRKPFYVNVHVVIFQLVDLFSVNQ